MKFIFVVSVFFVLVTSTAWADAFQFLRQTNGAPAAEAVVYYGNQLVGYANGQGILFINSPKGRNAFTVSYMGQTSQVELTVSGKHQVKKVYIK